MLCLERRFISQSFCKCDRGLSQESIRKARYFERSVFLFATDHRHQFCSPRICQHEDIWPIQTYDWIVSHDAPRFMLYYHCVRDISWSVFFSMREMSIAALDEDGFQACFGSAASTFENVELAYIHCALKEIFRVTLKGFSCVRWSVENSLVRSVATKHKVFDSATDKVYLENQNHDWSKNRIQQNSRYVVKLITKRGFITASRSKKLSLQRQLQIKLSTRQTILY